MPTPRTLALVDIMAIFGVTRATVDNWMTKGCPNEKQGRSFKFNSVEVFEWYKEEFLRERKDNNPATTAQIRIVEAKAASDEMSLAMRRTELVEVADVKATLHEWGSFAANAINQLPSRMAARLAPITDAHTIERLLTEEVRSIREHIRNAPGG